MTDLYKVNNEPKPSGEDFAKLINSYKVLRHVFNKKHMNISSSSQLDNDNAIVSVIYGLFGFLQGESLDDTDRGSDIEYAEGADYNRFIKFLNSKAVTALNSNHQGHYNNARLKCYKGLKAILDDEATDYYRMF